MCAFFDTKTCVINENTDYSLIYNCHTWVNNAEQLKNNESKGDKKCAFTEINGKSKQKSEKRSTTSNKNRRK